MWRDIKDSCSLNMLKNLNIFKTSASSKPQKRTKFHIIKKPSIVALLAQAQKKRVFLRLGFKGHEGLFNTALLGVYGEKGFMALDELTPQKGHKLFLSEKEAQVTGLMDGVELRFAARLIEAGSKSGLAFYKVAIPEALIYEQKRELFRVTVLGSQVPFRGYCGEEKSNFLQGTLLDISIGGVGVVLEEKVSLSHGDILSSCKIRLSDEDDITFSLKVCFINTNRPGGGTSFGGQFQDLQKSDEDKIAKFISEVQREKAKKT